MTRGVACALILLGVAAALGSEAAPAAPGVGLGFSLAAAGPGPYFSFDARPGTKVTGHVELEGRAGSDQPVALAPVDVGTAATGGLDYGDRMPRATGRWLALARRRLVLAPGQIASVPFTVAVPGAAGAGDHVAGIVATDPTELARQRLRARKRHTSLALAFRSRLAVAVVVRVPGRRRPHLSFRGAAIEESPAGVRIALRLRNTGNTLIKFTRGDVTVSQTGQAILATSVNLDTFAPSSEIRFPIALPGPPIQGRYHVSGTLHPQGAPRVRIDADVDFSTRQARRFEQQTGRRVRRSPGPPWILIGALLLAALAALAFAGAYLRARRRLRKSAPP